MKKKINFGIVGFGRIGHRYLEKIDENSNTQAVAIVDIDQSQLADVPRNIATFKKYSDLLKDDTIDVVVVAVPNHLHKEVTLSALKADKHVICEKPMALSAYDAMEMILASEKAVGRLFIVKQNRFNPPVKEVKKLIEDGTIGKVGMVVVNCYWNRNDDYYLSSDWKGKKSMDGGTLFTQFSHFIDIVYYLLGDFSYVFGKSKNFTHQSLIEFEDTGAVLFGMQNGAVGTLNYTTSAYNQNMEGSITIFGSKGTVKIGGQYLNTLDYYQIEGVGKIELEKGNAANDYGTYKGSMSNHDKIIENVVKTIRGEEFVATSAFEGMQVVRIIEAMYTSMSSGKVVELK